MLISLGFGSAPVRTPRADPSGFLPVRRTLEKLGIPRQTFYRWYDRYLAGGLEALEDRRPQPGRVWNRIPDEVRDKVVDLALARRGLSVLMLERGNDLPRVADNWNPQAVYLDHKYTATETWLDGQNKPCLSG